MGEIHLLCQIGWNSFGGMTPEAKTRWSSSCTHSAVNNCGKLFFVDLIGSPRPIRCDVLSVWAWRGIRIINITLTFPEVLLNSGLLYSLFSLDQLLQSLFVRVRNWQGFGRLSWLYRWSRRSLVTRGESKAILLAWGNSNEWREVRRWCSYFVSRSNSSSVVRSWVGVVSWSAQMTDSIILEIGAKEERFERVLRWRRGPEDVQLQFSVVSKASRTALLSLWPEFEIFMLTW